jgi:hypothetical protein
MDDAGIWLVGSSDDEDEIEEPTSPRVPAAQVWARETARLSNATAVETTLQVALACEATIGATLLEFKAAMAHVTAALAPTPTLPAPPAGSRSEGAFEAGRGGGDGWVGCGCGASRSAFASPSAAVAEAPSLALLAPLVGAKPWFDVGLNSPPLVGPPRAATEGEGPPPRGLPGGCHALHYAALGGDLALATRAVAAAQAAAETDTDSEGGSGIRVDPRANNGATPLHWAGLLAFDPSAACGSVVEGFVRVPPPSCYPLQRQVCCGLFCTCVRLFFCARARVFFFVYGGSLFCPASAGHASIVALLLAHGADPRARTATGAGAAPRDLAHAKVGSARPILLCKLLIFF